MPTGTPPRTTTRLKTIASYRRLGTGHLRPTHHGGRAGNLHQAAGVGVAKLLGRHLVAYQEEHWRCPPLAAGGLAPTTRQGHRRALRSMWDLPLDLHNAEADRALVEQINRLRRRKRWRWSTTVTNMARLQGALSLLPIYGRLDHTDAPILLRNSTIWKMAMRHATRRAHEQLGHQPAAATEAQIQSVLRNTNIPRRCRAAILLAWITAARCGDVLKLRHGDTELDMPARKLTVTWHRGKTVAKRGAYTVNTVVPQEFCPLLADCLNTAGTTPTQLAFPDVTGSQIKLALRTAAPQLEQRSVRRGALQLLASLGMPHSTLMLFSGHCSEKMLLRYLGYGRLAKAQAATMIAAAQMAYNTAV